MCLHYYALIIIIIINIIHYICGEVHKNIIETKKLYKSRKPGAEEINTISLLGKRLSLDGGRAASCDHCGSKRPNPSIRSRLLPEPLLPSSLLLQRYLATLYDGNVASCKVPAVWPSHLFRCISSTIFTPHIASRMMAMETGRPRTTPTAIPTRRGVRLAAQKGTYFNTGKNTSHRYIIK